MIILSGKSHSKPPSTRGRSCPRTLSSPLTLTIVGAQHWVTVMVRRPKDCLVRAIQALYQSSLTRYSGAPSTWDATILKPVVRTRNSPQQCQRRIGAAHAKEPIIKYEPEATAFAICESAIMNYGRERIRYLKGVSCFKINTKPRLQRAINATTTVNLASEYKSSQRRITLGSMIRPFAALTTVAGEQRS